MDFPSSSLHDPDDVDEVTTSSTKSQVELDKMSEHALPTAACALRNKPKQLWPSPSTHLRGMATASNAPTAVVLTPASTQEDDHPHTARQDSLGDRRDATSPEQQDKTQAEVTDVLPATAAAPVGPAKRMRRSSSRDSGYPSDDESNIGTRTTKASTARTSASGLSSIERLAYSRSSQDLLAKERSTSPNGSVNHNKRHWRKSLRLAPFIERLRAEQQSRQQESATFSKAPKFKEQRSPSQSYEADNEKEESDSSCVGMGSRSSLDQARADRNDRYAALQSMTADLDPSTDEDSEFGVDLTLAQSSAYGRVPSGGQGGDIDVSAEMSKFSSSSPRAHLSSVNPLNNDSGDRVNPFMSESESPNNDSLSPPADTIQPTSGKAQLCFKNVKQLPIKDVWELLSHCRSDHPMRSVPINDYLRDKHSRQNFSIKGSEFIPIELPSKSRADIAEDYPLITSSLDPNIMSESSLDASHTHATTQTQLSPISVGLTHDHHFRSVSGQSDVTASDCALTTHHPECYLPITRPPEQRRSNEVKQQSDLTPNAHGQCAFEQGQGASDSASCRSLSGAPQDSRKTSASNSNSSAKRASDLDTLPSSRIRARKPCVNVYGLLGHKLGPALSSTENNAISVQSTLGVPSGVWTFPPDEYIEGIEARLDLLLKAHRAALAPVPTPAPGCPQRLADVSMVEARKELERRKTYLALCKFIYDMERDAKAERKRNGEDSSDDDEEEDSPVTEQGDGHALHPVEASQEPLHVAKSAPW
ncbi:MAG: hypothetical protein Q9220_001053 [cf. Caloplaca sp. 1 TL-2023]